MGHTIQVCTLLNLYTYYQTHKWAVPPLLPRDYAVGNLFCKPMCAKKYQFKSFMFWSLAMEHCRLGVRIIHYY